MIVMAQMAHTRPAVNDAPIRTAHARKYARRMRIPLQKARTTSITLHYARIIASAAALVGRGVVVHMQSTRRQNSALPSLSIAEQHRGMNLSSIWRSLGEVRR
jgi:hypothetical protein